MTPMNRRVWIEDLRQFMRDTTAIVGQFPRLQGIPTSRLGLSTFAERALDTKTRIEEQLVILGDAVDNLDNRLDLPILVGLVGKFSTGKSSLINAFFKHIFGGEVPANLLRQTGDTPTDIKFTYITHSDYADRFRRTDDIEVVTSDHEVFRHINFIDTPGTGWTRTTTKEVNDLLSASDIMLFIARPFEVLDSDSVESLYVKFTRYPKVPIWYVFTYASHYLEPGGDWSCIQKGKFEHNLSETLQKLATRSYNSQEEETVRDLVAENIRFAPAENTFLVDAKYYQWTQNLFERLLKDYGSPTARAAKLQQINRDVQSRYQNLLELLNDAGDHIGQLAELLRTNCSTAITNDAATFRQTTVASEAAWLSQRMLSQLRPRSLTIAGSYTVPQSLVSVTYAYTPPEVSILQTRLGDMRRDKLQTDFIYRADDLLFNQVTLAAIFASLRNDLVEAVKRGLDSAWKEQQSTSLPQIAGVSRVNLDLTALDKAQQELLDYEQKITERKKSLVGRFGYTVSDLVKLYADSDLKKTVFNRQLALLDDMHLNIPSMFESARLTCSRAAQVGEIYATQVLGGFDEIVNSQQKRLQTDATQFLHENAYLPVKVALDFLFGQTGSDSDSASDHELPLTFEVQLPVERLRAEIGQTLDGLASTRIGEFKKTEADWQTEWLTLKQHSDALIKDAGRVAHTLRANGEFADKALTEGLDQGVREIQSGFRSLRTGLQETPRRCEKLIVNAVKEAKDQGKIANVLQVIGAGVGIAGAMAALVKALIQGQNPNLWVVAGSVSVGVPLAAVMIARIIARQARFAQLVQRIYERDRDSLLREIVQTLETSTKGVLDDLTRVNKLAASDMQRQYDKCIDDCVSANDHIVGQLDKQLTSAAQLAVSTTGRIAALERDLIADATTTVDSFLDKISTQWGERFRKVVTTSIGETTGAYVARLDQYIKLYTRLTGKTAELKSQVETKLGKINALVHDEELASR